jgi:hypothetical protein
MAWGHIEDLHRAFEPWGLSRTGEKIKNILGDHELPISELERIEVDADALEDVDWRMSLLQDAMDSGRGRFGSHLAILWLFFFSFFQFEFIVLATWLRDCKYI